MAIATGKLRIGDQLPSVRALAEDLVLNPNTIAHAYTDLTRDGLIESRSGRGVFIIRKRKVFTREEGRRRLEPLLDALIGEAMAMDFTREELHELLQFLPKGRDLFWCGQIRFRHDLEQCGVHARWTGEDVPGSQPGVVVRIPIGDYAAGLANDQCTGADVPRSEVKLEEAVEHAFGRPAQVETGGSDPPQILEALEGGVERGAVSRKEVLTPERESGCDDGPRFFSLPSAPCSGIFFSFRPASPFTSASFRTL